MLQSLRNFYNASNGMSCGFFWALLWTSVGGNAAGKLNGDRRSNKNTFLVE